MYTLKMRETFDKLADETVSIAQMQIKGMGTSPSLAFRRSIAFSYELLIDQLIVAGIIEVVPQQEDRS